MPDRTVRGGPVKVFALYVAYTYAVLKHEAVNYGKALRASYVFASIFNNPNVSREAESKKPTNGWTSMSASQP